MEFLGPVLCFMSTVVHRSVHFVPFLSHLPLSPLPFVIEVPGDTHSFLDLTAGSELQRACNSPHRQNSPVQTTGQAVP